MHIQCLELIILSFHSLSQIECLSWTGSPLKDLRIRSFPAVLTGGRQRPSLVAYPSLEFTILVAPTGSTHTARVSTGTWRQTSMSTSPGT